MQELVGLAPLRLSGAPQTIVGAVQEGRQGQAGQGPDLRQPQVHVHVEGIVVCDEGLLHMLKFL